MKWIILPIIAVCGLYLTLASQGLTKEEPITIGLSIGDLETERWPVEQALLSKLAKQKGINFVTQVANHDTQLQNRQIDNMVSRGADVVIIIAEDGTSAASAVDSAARKGVPSIAYDRLVKSDKLGAYISFDNLEVGRTQARAILKRVSAGNFVLLSGSPTDNNAVLVRKGQMEILQPFVDQGLIEIVGDQWVENWSTSNAFELTKNILEIQNNKVDAILAANDGIALGALQAMRIQGLAGRIPISGQDASAAGCRSIVEGELTMSVFKDVRLLSPMAVDIAVRLAKGEPVTGLQAIPLTELTRDDSLTGSVPCKFLSVVEVDRSNLYDEIIMSEFQNYDEVYSGIPEEKRPPRP